jgi:hypothetical protein
MNNKTRWQQILSEAQARSNQRLLNKAISQIMNDRQQIEARNAILWLYRRLPDAYGRMPRIEKSLRDLGCQQSEIDEVAALKFPEPR